MCTYIQQIFTGHRELQAVLDSGRGSRLTAALMIAKCIILMELQLLVIPLPKDSRRMRLGLELLGVGSPGGVVWAEQNLVSILNNYPESIYPAAEPTPLL